MSMTPEQWASINDDVSTRMLQVVRPCVTPLTREHAKTVRTVGTGTYVDLSGGRCLLTCEHVAREAPLDFRFFGSKTDNVFRSSYPWVSDAAVGTDSAYQLLPNKAWSVDTHQAAAVPFNRFSVRHHLAQPEELLFFMVFAGENSFYGFGQHDAYGTGYLSQQKLIDPAPDIFEMLWRPGVARFAGATSKEAAELMGVMDARGFSGSLVWNTRFLEVTAQGKKWTPQDAMITGLVRRWDEDTETLLVWRVEHLRAWLTKNGHPF